MSARVVATGALVVLSTLAIAPDPCAVWNDADGLRPAMWLDPALRVPFSSVLLREPDPHARPMPGDRVLGLRFPDDGGLLVPRGRTALLAALAARPDASQVVLWVQRGGQARDRFVELRRQGIRQTLREQWPVVLAGTLLLLFAAVCAIGGRHPVATPLAAVTAALGTGLLATLDLALPEDRGLLGIESLRPRMGLLAWSLLPAALLHLAARFPVTMPRFRRPALAALPWALWAVPAALAQLHFDTAAVGHAVERVALTASFLAGGILVAGCLWPGRRLSPVERFRARAAVSGLVIAGVGPLLVFVAGPTPRPNLAPGLALGVLGLPIALGWAVARYRLLDPPVWLLRVLSVAAGALAAIGLAAAALRILARAVPDVAPAPALALMTALFFCTLQPVFLRAVRLGRGRREAVEMLLARVGRELAGASEPSVVLARLASILRSSLGASAVEVTSAPEPGHEEETARSDRRKPSSPLLRSGIALCAQAPARAGVAWVRVPRLEDPQPLVPEVALRLEPRGGSAAFVVVAPRADGLPYTPEELSALVDVGRLAALALSDALDAARLEALVAERTAALRRALADRNALVTAAQSIQRASETRTVRTIVADFLTARRADFSDVADPRAAGRAPVVVDLSRPPLGSQRLTSRRLPADRVMELQPQADTVGALADLAIERLHRFDGLKLEVERQARELAHIASDRHNAEFVRRVAHELRKPGEEIRQLVAGLAPAAAGPVRVVLTQIESAAFEMGRRLDTLLSHQECNRSVRRVDLVRLIDEALRRVAIVRSSRRFVTVHPHARLPLLGDPVRLVSLIENLLDNAARATGDGGRIDVRSGLLTPAVAGVPSRVSLEVEDDGEGIPPDLADEIFEPGVGTFCGGFGLGLSLCRDVVAVHSGEIAVESRPGRTVFRVLLPQIQEESAR